MARKQKLHNKPKKLASAMKELTGFPLLQVICLVEAILYAPYPFLLQVIEVHLVSDIGQHTAYTVACCTLE